MGEEGHGGLGRGGGRVAVAMIVAVVVGGRRRFGGGRGGGGLGLVGGQHGGDVFDAGFAGEDLFDLFAHRLHGGGVGAIGQQADVNKAAFEEDLLDEACRYDVLAGDRIGDDPEAIAEVVLGGFAHALENLQQPVNMSVGHDTDMAPLRRYANAAFCGAARKALSLTDHRSLKPDAVEYK